MMPTNSTSSLANIPRTPRALWLLALACACSESTYQYTAEADAEAMLAIARVWDEGTPQGIQLSICEDLSVDDSLQDGCIVNHVVRGEGRGMDHEAPQAQGCGGGCTAQNVAFVRGTIESETITPARAVSGSVDLFNAYADGDDPYAYPYFVYLTCDDAAAPCEIRGEIEADGSLAITLSTGLPGSANDTTHQLTGATAAACPAPNS
ncbi:MAG: hypothetical protein IPL79_09790 [Myxococcales bacterium]|nr:hypothetical protein [Myxococcales bacterium]